jgi:gamma-glutamyl phosphate reductase
MLQERQAILHAIADALESRQEEIKIENEKDIAAAVAMEMSEAMRARLVLSTKKIATLADGTHLACISFKV